MKKLLSALCVLSVLVFPVATYAQKIGYVNSNMLLSEYAKVTGVEKKLEAKFSGAKKELDDLVVKIKALEKEIKTNELLMTESKLLASKTKLDNMLVQYRKMGMALEGELKVVRKKEMVEFSKIVNTIIKKYAVDKKYDLILNEGAIFAGENVNITDDITSLLIKAIK